MCVCVKLHCILITVFHVTCNWGNQVGQACVCTMGGVGGGGWCVCV